MSSDDEPDDGGVDADGFVSLTKETIVRVWGHCRCAAAVYSALQPRGSGYKERRIQTQGALPTPLCRVCACVCPAASFRRTSPVVRI